MALKPNQIENMLTSILELKDKLLNAKAILKGYKITSDRLSQLKVAKKDISMQIQEETKRIEEEFMADKDFEQAKQDEKKYKNSIAEKNGELRELMSQVNVDQTLSTYNYNIKGEELKMQVERVVKVYINGREEK